MAQREVFTSRWSLILAALGMVIGTGNIWRFPRIVAKNGGGAFLVAWFVFLFLWSIPLLIAEFAIGKKTRKARLAHSQNSLVIASHGWVVLSGFARWPLCSIILWSWVGVCVFSSLQ